MEIIFGEHQTNKTKFFKKIGDKTFYYNGNKDKVIFIEDIIFSNVSKYKPELIKNRFCSITYINKEKYIISFFNDINNDNQEGEKSLEYLLKDFTEEEIKNFIQLILKEQNYNNDTIILLTIENNLYKFNNLYNEIEENVIIKEQDLNIEIMLSGYKKYAKIYIYISIFIILGIMSIYASNYFKSKNTLEIKILENQQKNLEKKKKEIEKEIIEEKIKFNKLELKKHLLEPNNLKELEEKIYNLGLKESLKENK